MESLVAFFYVKYFPTAFCLLFIFHRPAVLVPKIDPTTLGFLRHIQEFSIPCLLAGVVHLHPCLEVAGGSFTSITISLSQWVMYWQMEHPCLSISSSHLFIQFLVPCVEQKVAYLVVFTVSLLHVRASLSNSRFENSPQSIHWLKKIWIFGVLSFGHRSYTITRDI